MRRILSRKKEQLYSAKNQELAKILKVLREREGLSQGEFAAKWGINYNVYQKWESGQVFPKLDQVFLFLKILGPEGRHALSIHLGPLLDMLRGTPDASRAQAFEALDEILRSAPETVKERIVGDLVETAGKYGKR